MSTTGQLIFPANHDSYQLAERAVKEFSAQAIDLVYQPPKPEELSPYTNQLIFSQRLDWLRRALRDNNADFILCGRGGYGTSELLAELDWAELQKSEPKTVCGFSDITFLLSAVWCKLGWRAIHSAMPATTLWNQTEPDAKLLFQILRGQPTDTRIAVRELGDKKTPRVSGWLYGGCLSIMCALIGTDFFPKTTAGSILFMEETNESLGCLKRNWIHCKQAGVFDDPAAIIIGDLGLSSPQETQYIEEWMMRHCDCPVYSSRTIGHVSPNLPLEFGAMATLTENQLIWSNTP